MPPEPESAPASGPGGALQHRPVWWIALSVILLDQLTKLLVTTGLPLYDSRTVVPGLLNIVHVQNRGVAFGLFNDAAHPLRGTGTMVLAGLALAGIAYYARQLRPEEHMARLGLALILGGAIGNLIDRIRLGYVTDFVDVYWGGWHFWAFNVADAAISVGAVLIFVDLLIPRRHASRSV